MSKFVDALLEAARGWLGHMEVTRNSSPEIDQWLAYVHASPGDPWCQAWVCGMFRQAATSLDIPNPCPRTAGALRLWELAPVHARRVLPAPGDVFVLDTGESGGAGHVGILEAVSPDGLSVTSIEGNSNKEGSREGNAVVRHSWLPAGGRRGTLLGYLTLAPEDPPAAIGLDSLPRSPFA